MTTVSRRALMQVAAAGAVAAGFPGILRAQSRDLVVGGAAGMAGYMREFVFPVIERRTGMRVVFDGTRSLVNLEKLRADKASPRMSVVLMDDPIMQIAWGEGLLERLTPSATPNISKLRPDGDPSRRRLGQLPGALGRHRLQQGFHAARRRQL